MLKPPDYGSFLSQAVRLLIFAWQKSSRHSIPDFPEPKALFYHINSLCFTIVTLKDGTKFHSTTTARLLQLHVCYKHLPFVCYIGSGLVACFHFKINYLIKRNIRSKGSTTGNWAYFPHISMWHLSISSIESFRFKPPKATFQSLHRLSFHLDFGKRNDIEWSVILSALFWTAQQADWTELAIFPMLNKTPCISSLT